MQGESVSQDTDSSAAIPKGFGRITRDEAGQVLHIEMAEGEDEDCHPGIVLDMGASGLELDDPVLQKWTKTMGVATNAGPNNVVRGMTSFYSFSFVSLLPCRWSSTMWTSSQVDLVPKEQHVILEIRLCRFCQTKLSLCSVRCCSETKIHRINCAQSRGLYGGDSISMAWCFFSLTSSRHSFHR